MTEPSNAHDVVLAAVDRTTAGDEVIRTALALSRASPAGELHFVHVVDPKLVGRVPHAASDVMVAGEAFLEPMVAAARELTPVRVDGHLRVGEPVTCILETALELGADLLIVGTHDKRHLGWLIGSVSRKVLRRAKCAVLLARAKDPMFARDTEQACPACTNARFATGGEQLWCAEHAVEHIRGHFDFGGAP